MLCRSSYFNSSTEEKFLILHCRTIQQFSKNSVNCIKFKVTKTEDLPVPLPKKELGIYFSVQNNWHRFVRTIIVKKQREEAFAVLITYSVIRAVQLELVRNLQLKTVFRLQKICVTNTISICIF